MEYRRLTASDLASLLELYKQLDEDDDECPMDQSEEAWKEIEANAYIQYFGAIDSEVENPVSQIKVCGGSVDAYFQYV